MHLQTTRTLQEVRTTLSPDAALALAVEFFATRSGIYAAYPEREGDGYVVLRGMGGEEIAVAAAPLEDGSTRVSGSSFMFDAQVARFLSALPPAP